MEMSMDFIELSDGTLLNPAGILRVHSNSRANRVEHINGVHYTLTDEDAQRIRKALTPNRVPSKPPKR